MLTPSISTLMGFSITAPAVIPRFWVLTVSLSWNKKITVLHQNLFRWMDRWMDDRVESNLNHD